MVSPNLALMIDPTPFRHLYSYSIDEVLYCHCRNRAIIKINIRFTLILFIENNSVIGLFLDLNAFFKIIGIRNGRKPRKNQECVNSQSPSCNDNDWTFKARCVQPIGYVCWTHSFKIPLKANWGPDPIKDPVPPIFEE